MDDRSPAVCGRGLKHTEPKLITCFLHVARRVRAWIETEEGVQMAYVIHVARRVRAWIETYRAQTHNLLPACRPPCAGVD